MEKMTAKQFILRVEQSIEKYFLLALVVHDAPLEKLTNFLLSEWRAQHEHIQAALSNMETGEQISYRSFIRHIIRLVIYARFAKHLQIKALRDDYEAFFLHWREYVFLAYQHQYLE